MDGKLKYTILMMTIAISMTRVGMGYQMSILGQNLLYFTRNINVSVASLSFCFMAGSLGMIAGSFMAAGLKSKYPLKQFYVMGVAAGVFGLVASSTPWIRVFWLFLLGYITAGVSFGVLETGLTALILELLGEKESRRHIQFFHLNFVFGAFIGPLIAGTLIQSGKTGLLEQETKGCQLNISDETTDDGNLSAESSSHLSATNTSNYNGNAWSYHLVTFWMVVPTAMMIYLGITNMEEKFLGAAVQNGIFQTKVKNNTDEPLKSVIWILLTVTGFYTSIVAMDAVVHYFIYSIAICSELSFTVTQAILLNALTWLGSGVGRVIALLLAKRVRPLLMILFGITISIFSCVIMSSFGQSHPGISWGWSFLYGCSTSILYPSGICWLSPKVHVTGIYMFVFTLGASLGGILAIPVAGAVFGISVFSVIHVITGLCLLTGIFFLLSMFAVRGRSDNVDDDLPEKENAEKDVTESVLLRRFEESLLHEKESSE